MRLDEVLAVPGVQWVRLANWPPGMAISARGHFSALEVMSHGWEVAHGRGGGTSETD